MTSGRPEATPPTTVSGTRTTGIVGADPFQGSGHPGFTPWDSTEATTLVTRLTQAVNVITTTDNTMIMMWEGAVV